MLDLHDLVDSGRVSVNGQREPAVCLTADHHWNLFVHVASELRQGLVQVDEVEMVAVLHFHAVEIAAMLVVPLVPIVAMVDDSDRVGVISAGHLREQHADYDGRKRKSGSVRRGAERGFRIC